MTARRIRLLLAILALATLSIPAAPASAQFLTETNLQVQDFQVVRSTPQAGAHPKVDIRMRFCNEGLEITNVTGVGQPIRITTATPHGITAPTLARPIYVGGNTAANVPQAVTARPVTGSPTDNQVDLFQGTTPLIGNGDYTGGGELHLYGAPGDRSAFGCTTTHSPPDSANLVGDAGRALIRDFTLKLPPGFLGNPTALPQCPTFLWLAGSCPDNTQLGHVVADAWPISQKIIFVPTNVFNLQTMGLEPARLGTEVVPAFPPGPLPNTVTIRTTGDYGIDSSQINIPKELGASVGIVRNIHIVLCDRVPCSEPKGSGLPELVEPIEPARPFFVNPTSCGTKMARLEARAWAPADPGDAMEAPITTTGCDQVRFEAGVNVTPKDASPGASDEQQVSIDYPRSDRVVENREVQTVGIGSTEANGGTYTLSFSGETTAPIPFGAQAPAIEAALNALPNLPAGGVTVTGGPLFGPSSTRSAKIRFSQEAADVTIDASSVTGPGAPYPDPVVTKGTAWGCPPSPQEPGCTYDFDKVWQAALKDADVTLPPGMSLAPGGGEGLQVCTFAEFGVNPTTGKQETDDPVKCPEGSHVGDIEVVSPALPTTTNANGEPVSIAGKAFFGPTGSAGRPTVDNPWKLFLLLEGHGLRIKLVGNVSLSESGQVRTIFQNQPEVPFGHFRLKMGNARRAVLLNPLACGTHTGTADLRGYNGKTNVTNPSVTPEGCSPSTFSVNIDEAKADPEQAGAHSVSRIKISRTDASDMLSGLKLSLPPGAAGSLSNVPKCPFAQAQAGTCPDSTLVGNIKTTLGSSSSLFTVPGKLFLAEPAQAGDVASIVATVPAKAGVPDASGKYPIDLGPDVVIINRLQLREADTGVDVFVDGAYQGGQKISDGIPTILQGVPLPIRQIEIVVDREGFFLNPTGCEPRPVVGTFTSASGLSTTSSVSTQATGCERLPFNPTLYMIVGEAGKTRAGQNVHPPLTAIVTQKAGEAAISRARVLVPDIVRPNVPFLNEPGVLCTDAQAQSRTCPPTSLVGSARVITPVLPFELNGPVHIVQEIGSILPKLYVYLRGGGFEVLLRARNRITGVRTENTFDFVPDVPQSYFELKIFGGKTGGKTGLLNNFFDLCKTAVDSKSRRVEATFNGHNGAVKNAKFPVRVEGCGSTLASARISSARIKVNRKGIAKVKVSCRRKDRACKGRLAIKAKSLSATKSFNIAKRKARTLKLKFSKGEVRKLRKAKRKQMKGRATTKVGSSSTRRAVTLVYRRR